MTSSEDAIRYAMSAVEAERERIRKAVNRLPGRLLYRHSKTVDSVIETKVFLDRQAVFDVITPDTNVSLEERHNGLPHG